MSSCKDEVVLGFMLELAKETGLDHWDSYEDFVKRLSERCGLSQSKVYPMLRRFDSHYILVDKMGGLNRRRVILLMDKIEDKVGEIAHE